MRQYLLFFVLFGFLSTGLAASEDLSTSLSPEDARIFNETLQICKPGTVSSAIQLGLNSKNFVMSLNNWMQLANFSYEASKLRNSSGGLSPAIYRQNHSQGFWLAMAQCYGYTYGKLNYGNLMKQIVDLGQLTTEVTGAGTAIATVATTTLLAQQIWSKFPLVGRFIFAAYMAKNLGNLIHILGVVSIDTLTPLDVKHLEESKKIIFEAPDQAIQEIILMAQNQISNINLKLQSSNISEEQRARLVNDRERIENALNKLAHVDGH